jgi:RimJ/RimL family protein N-acetyltransferase
MNHSGTRGPILATGPRVILRDAQPSDAESYVYWQSHGEWRFLDAPWEGSDISEEKQEQVRRQFLEKIEQELPWPRTRAFIATRREDQPLGWVSRYGREQSAWSIGIDICVDTYLNRGFGTEALGLWVDYLFAHSGVHRLGIDTWSFNPRMKRVAEKLGFLHEGTEREVRLWEGEWLDAVHYGVLRREWQGAKERL